jgi:hypothetical protein
MMFARGATPEMRSGAPLKTTSRRLPAAVEAVWLP